ncbi:hypothetical protein [Roseisalinus antarcticus]|uniref:hypothetical protein n=1 Tax=Roseisalinus antarcticus TaxID=254357 RepID=UPI00117A128E|nr:hypothetical protein [Roseisalinus antarcticus]
MRAQLLLCGAALALAACVDSTTTRLSQNRVQIDVSAAPVCRGADARRFANHQAALETLRLGYDRYIVLGFQSQDNTRVVGANFNPNGFGGVTATPIIGGSEDASIIVEMYQEGRPGSGNALSAREALGPNWQQIVSEGLPDTCT